MLSVVVRGGFCTLQSRKNYERLEKSSGPPTLFERWENLSVKKKKKAKSLGLNNG